MRSTCAPSSPGSRGDAEAGHVVHVPDPRRRAGRSSRTRDDRRAQRVQLTEAGPDVVERMQEMRSRGVEAALAASRPRTWDGRPPAVRLVDELVRHAETEIVGLQAAPPGTGA
ncbi:hypothetical protein ACIQNT_31145 [Streptomyces luteogriseus]|uniref:hypothetical protein n=1 Tax=Streptomyces luteogriseus TaxID=68233 RepID=UPI0038121D0C